MIDFSQFDSLIAMTMYFNNEEVCKNAIIEIRWGVGEQQDVVCPYCGKHHIKMSKSGRFHCTACNHNFSCKVGTIFEDSNLDSATKSVKLPTVSKIAFFLTVLRSYTSNFSCCLLTISPGKDLFGEQKERLIFVNDFLEWTQSFTCKVVHCNVPHFFSQEGYIKPSVVS